MPAGSRAAAAAARRRTRGPGAHTLLCSREKKAEAAAPIRVPYALLGVLACVAVAAGEDWTGEGGAEEALQCA